MEKLGSIIDNTGVRRSSRLRTTNIVIPSTQAPKVPQQTFQATPKSTKSTKKPQKELVKNLSINIKKPLPVSVQVARTSPQRQISYNLLKTKSLRRRRTVSLNYQNRYSNIPIRKNGSMSLSPIYKNRTSLVQQQIFIQNRIKIYQYINTLRNSRYFLNIQKLLANIQNKATGIVCLSNNSPIIIDNKFINNFKFAIKIAENKVGDSQKEIFILENIRDFIFKGYHNLPLIYTSFQNKREAIIDNINKSNINEDSFNNIQAFLKPTKNYNIYVSELADGDLKGFLQTYDKIDGNITEEILLNAVAQIFFCIASLHNIGIRHNDTHFGNFLYHKVQPGGYIKYTIQDKTYYVKNLGYIWVIWDFGISTQINGISDYFYDYEMLSLFLRKHSNKYNMHFKANKEIVKANKTVNVEVRRFHGYISFKNKLIPNAIDNITNIIYELSIDKKINVKPDILDVYEADKYFLGENKDVALKELINNASIPNYRITDSKNKIIDEATFLNMYLLPNLLNSVVYETYESISDTNNMLFDIELHLDDIIRIIGEDKKTDYPATIKKYQGKKIILPRKYLI